MTRVTLAVRALTAVAACAAVAMAINCSGPAAAPQAAARPAQPEDDFAVPDNHKPSPKTLHAMARILTLQGKDQEAQYVLLRLVQDYPKFVPAYSDLAELQMRHDRIDMAAITLGEALKIAPNDPVTLNNMGMCDMARERYEQALGRFTAAVARNPDNARYRTNMAAALGMLGRYDESAALYVQVMSPLDAHWNLAVLAEARKDTSRAAVEFTLAESVSPGASTRPTSQPTSMPAEAIKIGKK